MKTQVIRIGESQDDVAYPVELYLDDESAEWRKKAVATGTIAVVQHDPAAGSGSSTAGEFCPACIVKFLFDTASATPKFAEIGQGLWAMFEAGDGPIATRFAEHWDTYAKVSRDDGKPGLRTVLDIRPKNLRAVPWELMIRRQVPLFGQPLNPVLRGRLEAAPAPPANGWLLKVLVLVGTDDPAIGAGTEIDALGDALRNLGRMVDLRVERPSTLKELLGVYNKFRPEILHFIGHGLEVGDESLLEFAHGGQRRFDWKESGIRESLVLGPPRVAFLNACRTQTADVQLATRRASGSLADAFLDAGTLAVVAMQADIDGAAAAKFAASVYHALAEGEPIDVALAQARYDLRSDELQTRRREWCLPSLSVKVAVDDVLPRRPADVRERRTWIELTPEFAAIRGFVDRTNERLRLDPLKHEQLPPRLLIVRGPSSTGKTAMLHWVLEGCAWCDHRIKYVDLKRQDRRPGFLRVLRLIQQAERNPPSRLRLQLTGNFSKFDELAKMFDSETEAPATTSETSASRPDDPIDALFGAFRQGLVDSAGGKPLIIALDHLGGMLEPGFLKFLRPYLLDWVAQGRVDHIRVILGCTDDEYQSLELEHFTNLAQEVRIDNFPAAEFPALLTEFLLHRNVPRQEIPVLAPRPGPWPPRLLTDTYKVLRG